MVTETHLPLDICKRASCQPERDHLNEEYAGLVSEFDWIAKTAKAPDSGINQA